MPSPDEPMPADPVRVSGWLGLLCRVLMLWHPLAQGVVAANAFHALSMRGLPLALVLLGRLAVAAFGVAAGLALRRRLAAGVRMAQIALVLAAAADIFVYATPYVPNNRPPGDAELILAGWLAWYAAWLIYLWRSKRVRETY